MEYALLILNIVVFTIQTISFKEFNRSWMKNLDSYFLFNFLYFSLTVLVFVVFNRVAEPIQLTTAIMAVAFGVVFILTILFYMKAMELGPLSFSALIFSLALLIPIVVGTVFWHEPVSPLQIAGLVLLIVTIMLASRSPADEHKKASPRWLLFCLAASLGNGTLMSLAKTQQMLYPGREIEEFLILAFGLAAILSLVIFFSRRLGSRKKPKPSVIYLRKTAFAGLVLVAGLTTGFGNLTSLMLSGRIPAILQYPTVSGGIIIFSSALSIVLFKERLTRSGSFGLVLGLGALVLLSIR